MIKYKYRDKTRKGKDMELNIQLVSGFDAKTKRAGLVYELNLMKNGRILRQRSLDYQEVGFDFEGDKNEAFQLLNKEIKNVVEETKEKYGCSKIRLSVRDRAFGITRNMFPKEDIVKIKSLSDPLIFKQKTRKLFELTTAANNPELQKELQEIKEREAAIKIENEALNRMPRKELQSNDIKGFFKKLSAKKEVLKKIFNRKVLESNSESVFIDYSMISAFERKRYGHSLEIHSSEKNMKNAENAIYREMTVALGEHGEAVETLNDQVIEKIKEIKASGKKTVLNIPREDAYIYKNIKEKIEYNNLSDDVSYTNSKTSLYIKSKKYIDDLIKKDVELHLEKLKNPETVAVFTDGSVNKKKNISGSGILIKHQGNEISESFSTYKKKDATYAEYRAVKEALTKIVTNDDFKDKDIVLVSDKDSIAANIKKYLGARNSSLQSTKDMEKTEPFLKEICDIIKHFDLEDKIYFHNVKSHLYDDVKEIDKDLYYDFYYNNVVDEVARAGAKLKTKDEIARIEESLRRNESNPQEKKEDGKNKDSRTRNNRRKVS